MGHICIALAEQLKWISGEVDGHKRTELTRPCGKTYFAGFAPCLDLGFAGTLASRRLFHRGSGGRWGYERLRLGRHDLMSSSIRRRRWQPKRIVRIALCVCRWSLWWAIRANGNHGGTCRDGIRKRGQSVIGGLATRRSMTV